MNNRKFVLLMLISRGKKKGLKVHPNHISKNKTKGKYKGSFGT